MKGWSQETVSRRQGVWPPPLASTVAEAMERPESISPLPTAQPMTSTAKITSTMDTVKKDAIALNVAGTGATAGQKMETQSGGPPWPCWWC